MSIPFKSHTKSVYWRSPAAGRGIEYTARRQPQRRRGALAGRAAQLQPPTMQLGHRPRQRQAEPRALVLAGEAAVDLAEGAQRGFEIVRGDADAGVLDRQAEPVRVVAGADRDAAAGGGELDGIGQQVEQDLLEPPAVAEQVGQARRQRLRELDAGGLRTLAHQAEAGFDHRDDVDRLLEQLDLAELDLGDV